MDSKPPQIGSMSEPALRDSSLLSKSATGATFLIFLQVGTRALTFAVNQLLLRYLSPELLGLSTQLEVYSISVLFFARESLRVAIQRQNDTYIDDERNQQQHTRSDKSNKERGQAARKTQEVVNLAYISITLGLFFAIVLAWVYLKSLRSDPLILKTPYFKQALHLYGVAAFLELLAEPCFIVVQQKSEYRVRAAAESSATMSRCFMTCGSAVLAARNGTDIGVLPFALGQCAYALSLLLVYYRNVSAIANASGFSLMARAIHSSEKSHIVFSYFSRSLLTLGMSLFMQGVIKHVLTQGDVILVSYLASLQDQGTYALASNYGGLIARMLFQPIEESSRNYFGKLLSTVHGKPSKAMIESGSKNLHSLLRFYVLLSLSAVSVGPTVAPLLLNLVAGSRWVSTGAGEVLAKYCYYVPLLAVNGVTEAFISSVATESELNRQSAWMFTFSVGFAAGGYVFLRLFAMGAVGLVWANAINMALRILWGCSFISDYLKRNGSRFSMVSIMPQPTTIVVGVGTAAVLSQMQAGFTGGAIDIIKSGVVAGVFVVLLVISERQYLKQSYHSFRSNQ